MRMTAEADAIPCLTRTRAKAADFLNLTKPRLTALVLFTTMAGFYIGCRGSLAYGRLAHALIGTALLAGGAGACNMYAERRLDALMRRTARRPLASGRMHSLQALVFAWGSSMAGFVYLLVAVNVLSSLLAAIILLAYIFLYTPLKTRTWLSTLAGAVPGALPIVLGWTAATGRLEWGAGALFLIVYLWQLPHFYAIGWMHREDYARAGIPVLSVIDRSGKKTSRQILVSLALLLGGTALPWWLRLAGSEYMLGAMTLGVAFLAFGLSFSRGRDTASARRLFAASALYLPALLLLLMVYKTA